MEVKVHYKLIFLFIISFSFMILMSVKEGYIYICLTYLLPFLLTTYVLGFDSEKVDNRIVKSFLNIITVFSIICLIINKYSIETILLYIFNLYFFYIMFKKINNYKDIKIYFKINFIQFLFFKEKYFYKNNKEQTLNQFYIKKIIFEKYIDSKYKLNFNIEKIKIRNLNCIENKKENYMYFLIDQLKEKSILLYEGNFYINFNYVISRKDMNFDFKKYMNVIKNCSNTLLDEDIIDRIIFDFEFNKDYLTDLLNKKSKNINTIIKNKLNEEYTKEERRLCSYGISRENIIEYLKEIEKFELEEEMINF